MQGILEGFVAFLQGVLPLSPFRQYLDAIGELPYLSWLNWFFPIGDCLKVLFAWLGVVGLFYMYSIAMRWIKVIGD